MLDYTIILNYQHMVHECGYFEFNEAYCCYEEPVNPCSVCPNGATVAGDTLPAHSANRLGMTCNQIIHEAQVLRSRVRVLQFCARGDSCTRGESFACGDSCARGERVLWGKQWQHSCHRHFCCRGHFLYSQNGIECQRADT